MFCVVLAASGLPVKYAGRSNSLTVCQSVCLNLEGESRVRGLSVCVFLVVLKGWG